MKCPFCKDRMFKANNDEWLCSNKLCGEIVPDTIQGDMFRKRMEALN